MDERRKVLEAYVKQLQSGNPLAEDFVNPAKSVQSQALQARNLAEDALANEVLKNTGVPIPGKGSSQLKQEDFLNRILSERYPELSTDVRLQEMNDLGEYTDGKINVSKKIANDPLRSVSTALHEAGHQYDDKILKFDGTDDVSKLKGKITAPNGRLLTDIDPAEAYEIIAKGHHAEIHKLREGSFGLGALKSMLKSGNFKSIAGPVAGLGLGAAMMPDEASAADFIPGLDQAENAGSAMDDKMMQTEVKALQNYDQSQARKDALMKVRNGR